MAEPADKGEAEGCPPSPAPSGGKGWVVRDYSPGQGSRQLPCSTCLLASASAARLPARLSIRFN